MAPKYKPQRLGATRLKQPRKSFSLVRVAILFVIITGALKLTYWVVTPKASTYDTIAYLSSQAPSAALPPLEFHADGRVKEPTPLGRKEVPSVHANQPSAAQPPSWQTYRNDPRYETLAPNQRAALFDRWRLRVERAYKEAGVPFDTAALDTQRERVISGADVDKEYLASIRERVISGADVASVVSVKTAQPRPLREATREWEEDWARFEEDLDRTRERHRVEAETSRREYEAERQRRQLDALNSHLEEMNRRERQRSLGTPAHLRY